MADINKLADIQRAIDTVRTGDPDLRLLNISTLDDKVDSVTSKIDIQKVASIQQKLTGITGSPINLGAVTRIADCIKNIDDLIIEKVKKEAIKRLLSNKSTGNLKEEIGKITDMVKEANRIYIRVKELSEMSLVELLILAKNSGQLDRIALFKTINDKYSAVVGNLNEMLENIANLDICSMTNYKVGSSTSVPLPANVNTAAPSSLPNFTSPLSVNTNAITAKDSYDDVIQRMGLIASDRNNIEDSSANNAMLTELQMFSRTVINNFSTADESQINDVRASFNSEINNKLLAKQNEWSQNTRQIYKERAENLLYNAYKDSRILREYTILKNSSSIATGQRSGVGVTIYGGPDWDFTTFLDIKPSQRPADLISYWQNEKGYNIESQENKLQARGIKTGTLNLSDAYKGAYGATLRAGFSCASTKFPGGTQLQLKNQDGSIYDPAGINPSGIVTVDDTGNAELTFKKLDLFISREHVAAYKLTNMSSIEIFVVALGTKTNRQYARAQAKFGSSAVV